MKYYLSCFLILFLTLPALAQYNYEVSDENPFGKLNPEAPEEVGDFAPLIGVSECISESRAADGSWNPTVNMLWTFKYIMNGMAVQDETLKEDGRHSGSIRQFSPDSSAWYVHYYSSASVPARLPAWEGAKNDDGNIVLYREQQSPNGLDGFYRLTFYDITGNSFEWIGEWVNKDESFNYPTWKISCTKKKS